MDTQFNSIESPVNRNQRTQLNQESRFARLDRHGYNLKSKTQHNRKIFPKQTDPQIQGNSRIKWD